MHGYDLQHDKRYNLWLKLHGASIAVIAEGSYVAYCMYSCIDCLAWYIAYDVNT